MQESLIFHSDHVWQKHCNMMQTAKSRVPTREVQRPFIVKSNNQVEAEVSESEG